MPDSPARTCPTCATAIPASFPEGFCPKCMLASATPAAAVEAAEGDKTLAVPAPTPSQMLRPGGVPSVEMLRRIFPDLEILDVLGAGGMGAVYKARQPRLNRLVALKIMVAAPGHEVDFALRFEREAQVLARLSHPHIVILYDFGELGTERTGADPLFYFLMEYVDGTDLGQLIKSKELQPAQALAIVPQICEALQYAHDQGITHRDIKPANILIDKRGVVKIADFGLAKMVGGGTEEALMTGLTQTGTAMGTPHYMAPEQWEHPQQVDHRADIYALGVVFYEMLTGERPAGVFEPPSKKTKPPVDKKLDGVVMRAMDKNPDRRYQQAGQIGDEVSSISGANKRRPATTRGVPETKRSPLKPLLGLAIAAVLAVGGWMLWQGREVGPPAAAVPPQTALGGPSALPIAKPGLTGRLRGAGFHLDGKPLDLKNAEGITDFVQVILTDRGWVGLRANGELVTPEAGLGEKNIARLLPSWFNSYGTIDREGRLSIQRPGSEGVKAVPEEVQRIGVVDACWDGDGGQAIALLKDGSVRVWGEHYTTGYKDTPVWPSPPSEALRDVRKIAITHWRAATLRHDGKWHIWGGHGGSSGPFDLQPFERWGEIADIETTYEPFRVLTRSGQVYNLGGSRPLTSGLVAEGIEAISDHLLLPKGSPVWTWNSNRSRDSAQAEVDALLQQIGNRPRGTFDLRIVGDHDASNVAAVWIEPVETGSAAAAPASVPSNPGRLEGTGTMATGRTLELVKFDAYGDFVDVAGSSDFLVALRANGETVSSDGQADFQGIRRIARSFQGCHCFIDMAGSLRFHPSREMTLPSSLKGRVVVDAACGSHHGVALLEGGQAVVFGKRYEDAMDDMSKRDGTGTPRWPQPEAAALQKVKGVAVTYTHAATLHEDGTVSVWGWEGPVKWQPEAKMKPVRQISSHHDSLHLLDEAGQVWSFPMPRSAHPEQPVGFNGTVKPLGTAAVRLRDHLWLGTDGAWHGVAADRPVQELLERMDLQPETTFALLSSTANAIPYGYVLWIEPVVPGGAVSTSTSPPVSPSSAATPLPFTDREAAEWVLGLGYDACNVKVLKGGRVIEVRKLADLPAEPWVIQELRVNLSPKEQPELWGKVTDAQVMRLAGLKSLKLVEIRGNVTGASLKVMAHHPGLERLDFEGLNLRADDLRHLRASPLQTLEIPLLQVTDPESLAVLTTMPNLLTLQFDGSLDPALAAALPNLPKLEILRANTSANTTDEVLPLLAERLPQLSVLQHWGAKNLKGSTLGSLMALKSLTTLGLTDTSVNDEGLAQIAGMPQLLTLDLGQTRITDACLPTLKSFPKLESLQIYQTELTDAALLELAAIPTLKRLGTKASGYSDWKPGVTFTEAGIAAFQKLRPDVEVVK